ncbi:MAG: hypothetical protein A2W91_13455 [Bacteroidetes bacterium GWF2_38_335]|nr:MAG: hypothetical protein A2W91_13455 [Bacteroidetes bacterium GWF2_38_335]OFY77258.1 MAG: hypothetical protein A2281_15120 [Bacteroidetes bacterium RIFOXYA12_FULL_38_20]HBS85738.1 hypothetical protein [Bacteroidales bacterium]
MKLIRKILYKILGMKLFISLVSRIYLFLVNAGFLKSKYPELFHLEKIVKPGFTSVDIGANVGYYSFFMSKYSGKQGRVYAVEPIPLFAGIWKKNVRRTRIDNLTMLPYALGGENKTVQMGIPERDGVLHHGMTKITSTADEKYLKFFDVEMKIPDELFSQIEKIDFIKCDVEGYEFFVFSNMLKTLEKQRPLIQTELSGKENREKVFDLLVSKGFKPAILKNGAFCSINKEDIFNYENDFYFLPE